MTFTVTCTVCAAPYAAVSDDPSPAHPGCAPSDRERYEAATRAPRTYTGRSRPALHEAGCRGCSGWIAAGELVSLADVDGTQAWVHDACVEQSDAMGPRDALSAPESAAIPLARPRTSPERESANQSPETTAPRRAA